MITPEEVRQAYAWTNGQEAAREEPEAVVQIVAAYLNFPDGEVTLEDVVTDEFPYVTPQFATAFEVVRLTYSGEFAAVQPDGIDKTCKKFHESDD